MVVLLVSAVQLSITPCARRDLRKYNTKNRREMQQNKRYLSIFNKIQVKSYEQFYGR